jgi:hypothetical protein
MIRNMQSVGLIVSTARRTATFDELANRLDWPVVAAATPRRLRDELPLYDLQCLLFWLEDHREVSATVNLVAWLRERSPGLYRIAIGYRMNVGAEPVMRSAGMHVYLPAREIDVTLSEALWPLLEREGLATVAMERARAPTRFSGAPPDWGELRESEHPP